MQVGSLSANRNLLVVLAIIIELGLGALYYFQKYQPQLVVRDEKRQTLDKKRKDVREIELTKQLLEETRQEIEKLKTDIARLEKYFPEEVFVPRVLVLIENLAIATHVEVDSIRPGRDTTPARRGGTAGGATPAPPGAPAAGAPVAGAPAAAPPGAGIPATPGGPVVPGAKPGQKFDEQSEYKTSQVDLKVKGTFQNIYNFMNELATFPKLVVVDKIGLSTGGSKDDGSGGSGGDGSEEAGTPESGKEVEVGGYVQLTVDLPLTFYVQKKDAPAFNF